MKPGKTRTAQLAQIHSLPHQLAFGLRGGQATTILDVRSRSSFDQQAFGLADAVPIYVNETPVMLPDLERDQAILVYCDSEKQVSSNQVADWLITLGYPHVWVMEGGLPAWNLARRYNTLVSNSSREAIGKWIAAPAIK